MTRESAREEQARQREEEADLAGHVAFPVAAPEPLGRALRELREARVLLEHAPLQVALVVHVRYPLPPRPQRPFLLACPRHAHTSAPQIPQRAQSERVATWGERSVHVCPAGTARCVSAVNRVGGLRSLHTWSSLSPTLLSASMLASKACDTWHHTGCQEQGKRVCRLEELTLASCPLKSCGPSRLSG
eukprot:1607150-Rhodomonas_salina.1